MTKAREIISGALRFGLNKLAPGEQEDADLFNACLEGLNSIADEMNGGKSLLWRQILTTGTVAGVSGTLGTTWAALQPGDQILSASYSSGGQDIPLAEITIAQYQAIPTKTTTGQPDMWAHDGLSTVYFYPAPAGLSVTLRTQAAVADFADLDTDYVMPQGYKSALQAMLAEKMAPSLLGAIPADVARQSRGARLRLLSGMTPEIIGGGSVLNGLF
jgi:hypothetical protein